MEILHVKVIAMPFLPIPPYTNSANPVSNITPFTYGDGYTYLSLLEDMRVYLNTMIDSVNANTDSANDVVDQFTELVNHVNDAIADYGTQLDNWSNDFDVDFKARFDKLRADMLTLILTTTQTGIIFNPTRGFYDPIGEVISDIYHYLRVWAITAGDYDALELTIEDFDDKYASAYDFDIRSQFDPDAWERLSRLDAISSRVESMENQLDGMSLEIEAVYNLVGDTSDLVSSINTIINGAS